MERTILLASSKAEQVSDWIACTAGSGPVLVLHVVWFGVWVTVNAGAVRAIRPFDPFPFPFLTMTVSLEAIFLALFVLASQNRLTRQADKRSHLDLQIDLLAEREMTAVLQLLQEIAQHLEVQTGVTSEQLRDLMKRQTFDDSRIGWRNWRSRRLSHAREVRGQSGGFESGILSAPLDVSSAQHLHFDGRV